MVLHAKHIFHSKTNKQTNKQKQEQKKHQRLADLVKTNLFSIKMPNLLNTILTKLTWQMGTVE